MPRVFFQDKSISIMHGLKSSRRCQSQLKLIVKQVLQANYPRCLSLSQQTWTKKFRPFDDGVQNTPSSTHEAENEMGNRLPPRYSKRRKYIKEESTYGDVQGNKIVGDPFLSSPYPKTARNERFETGSSAAEEAERRQIKNPDDTSIIIFPGQGSQYVGMCGRPEDMPRYVQVLYEIASGVMNKDILDLCANGPKEELDKTIYCQPALLVSSLAALEKLREENPQAIESCVGTAGFSVGEIAALVFAGVLTFEDAMRITKVRAEAMQLASEITPSGMATVMYGADSKLNYSLLVAKEWCTREYNIENPVCSVANYLFPHCKVIAGHKEALEFLQMNYKDFKLRKVRRLPVSGAFHTELMKPAAAPVKAILESCTISKPRMPVFSNVTGLRYGSSEDVKRKLPQQIYKPVMWEQVVHSIYHRPKETEYPVTFECGPGSSLMSVLKMVNAKAATKMKSIEPFISSDNAYTEVNNQIQS